VKLWLDDTRPAPNGWSWAKTASEAISLLKMEKIEEISLDYDLGSASLYGTGYDVALFIEEGARSGSLEKMKWAIHSETPDGVYRMETALFSADRYWAS
jgi:hypothetical protein